MEKMPVKCIFLLYPQYFPPYQRQKSSLIFSMIYYVTYKLSKFGPYNPFPNDKF